MTKLTRKREARIRKEMRRVIGINPLLTVAQIDGVIDDAIGAVKQALADKKIDAPIKTDMIQE